MTYIPSIVTARLANDAVTSAKILNDEIVNADIDSAAAIAYSKLNLSASIVNADVANGAAIAADKIATGAADTVLQSDGIANTFSTTTGANARLAVSKNSGATVGTRRRINFIEGTGVTLTVADDAGNEEVDVTIAAGNGAVDTAVTTKVANYTVDLATDHVIFVDTTANAVTISLPGSHSAGQEVVVKDVGGNVDTNGIDVATVDADTIDGSASNLVFAGDYESYTFKSDGTNWWII